MGPVAQRIRARGYEPRCRGFESLLAHSPFLGEGSPFWGKDFLDKKVNYEMFIK